MSVLPVNPIAVRRWDRETIWIWVKSLKNQIEGAANIQTNKTIQLINSKRITGIQLDQCSHNEQQILQLFDYLITNRTAKVLKRNLIEQKIAFDQREISKLKIKNDLWNPNVGEKIRCIDTSYKIRLSYKATIQQVKSKTIRISYDSYPDTSSNEWIHKSEWIDRITIIENDAFDESITLKEGIVIKCNDIRYKHTLQLYDATIHRIDNQKQRIYVVFKGYSTSQGVWISNVDIKRRCVFPSNSEKYKYKNIQSWKSQELQAWVRSLSLGYKTQQKIIGAIRQNTLAGTDVSGCINGEQLSQTLNINESIGGALFERVKYLQNSALEIQVTLSHNRDYDTVNTINNNNYLFKEGQVILCTDIRQTNHSRKYEALISRVRKDKIFVIFKGFSESEGDWIPKHEWNTRISLIKQQPKKAISLANSQSNSSSEDIEFDSENAELWTCQELQEWVKSLTMVKMNEKRIITAIRRMKLKGVDLVHRKNGKEIAQLLNIKKPLGVVLFKRLSKYTSQQKDDTPSLEEIASNGVNHAYENDINNIEWNNKERKYKQHISDLKQKVNRLQRKLNNEEKEINEYKTKISLLERVVKSKDEQIKLQKHKLIEHGKSIKQWKQKCKELKQKYNKTMKCVDYLTWNYENIADWIVNINYSKYNKYYEKLKNEMENECIDGTCLEYLDKTDLHRFGITVFKDKKCIYNNINNLIEKTKRLKQLKTKNIWMNKSIIKWKTDDVLEWIISLKLPNKIHYKIIYEIEENSECTGEDINSLTSSEEVGQAFAIKNNKNLCDKIFEEIKKIKQENKYENEDEKDSIDLQIEKETFVIYLNSHEKIIVLNERVNKNQTIQSIKHMYKQQSGVEANINDIHLYSKSKLLPPNSTLEAVNIIDDKNLITVKFEVDGAADFTQ